MEVLAPFLKMLKEKILGKFGGLLFIYVASLVGKIKITTILARLGGEMGGLFSAKKFDKMFDNQVRFGLWCIVASCWTQLMKYLEKMVSVNVRTIIYENLHQRYFESKAKTMYRTRLDDTAVRFCLDCEHFGDELAHTFGHVLKPCIDILYLTLDLTRHIGAYPLMGFFGFFYLSKAALTAVRRGLPNSLGWYVAEEQRLEALLSDHHHAVHDYREEISFLGGLPSERDALMKKFRAAVAHKMYMAESFGFVKIMNTYVLKYGGQMCAFSMLIPSVYMDTSGRDAQQITSDYLFQASLLGALAEAVKDLTDSISCWSEVLAHGERIERLINEFDLRESVVVNSYQNGTPDSGKTLLKLQDATVQDPLGNTLAQHLNLSVRAREHTLIQGVNGVGKTSLFRTIAGLWETPNRKECILSNLKEAMFIPQRPYFMRNMPLRDQITYPQIGAVGKDEELRGLLKSVQLEDLTSRYKMADVEDWQSILSGGQKQRIVWARILYHRPKLVYLDEATAAINQDSLQQLYDLLLKHEQMTIIAISHSTDDKGIFCQTVKMDRNGLTQIGRV